MTIGPPPTLTRQAVHAALVELLTTGQHHHAATPATLHAVGDTRRTLAAEHLTHDPAARYAPNDRRLAALSAALGEIGTALFLATCRAPDPVRLYRALTELAAIALGWLDTLPDPHHRPRRPGRRVAVLTPSRGWVSPVAPPTHDRHRRDPPPQTPACALLTPRCPRSRRSVRYGWHC